MHFLYFSYTYIEIVALWHRMLFLLIFKPFFAVPIAVPAAVPIVYRHPFSAPNILKSAKFSGNPANWYAI